MTTLAAGGLRVAQGRSARAYVSAWPAIRPVLVIRSALLLLVVGNLGRVPIAHYGAKDAPVLLNDLAVLAVLAAGLLAGIRARTWRIDGPGLLGLAFAGVGGASAILAIPRFGLSADEVALSLAYLARWLAYFGVYLVMVNSVRAADAASIWRALEAAVLAIAAFGILQSIFLPDFAFLLYPSAVLRGDWDPHGHRLVSTILDPNLVGALLLLVLLVHLARISAGSPVPYWKPAVLFAALTLTLSRGSFLAFGVGVAVILVVAGIARRAVGLAALIGALSLPFAPLLIGFARGFSRFTVSDPSSLARIVDWLRAVTVIADNPILGVGFNTYGFAQRAYGWLPAGKASFSLTGGLLFVAVMTGLVGLALYLGMIGLVARRCRRIWRDRARSADDRGLAIGVAAATAATLVNFFFTNSLLFPFVMEPVWVLWALTYVVQRGEEVPAPTARGPRAVSLAIGRR